MRQDFIVKRPPLLNEVINKNRRSIKVAANDKRIWTTAIAQSAKQQLVSFDKPIWIVVNIGYKTTNTDPDGLYGSLKPIFDGLVKAGILKGDTVKHIRSPQLFTYEQQKDPLVLITMFDDYLEWFNFATKNIFNG